MLPFQFRIAVACSSAIAIIALGGCGSTVEQKGGGGAGAGGASSSGSSSSSTGSSSGSTSTSSSSSTGSSSNGSGNGGGSSAPCHHQADNDQQCSLANAGVLTVGYVCVCEPGSPCEISLCSGPMPGIACKFSPAPGATAFCCPPEPDDGTCQRDPVLDANSPIAPPDNCGTSPPAKAQGFSRGYKCRHPVPDDNPPVPPFPTCSLLLGVTTFKCIDLTYNTWCCQ